MLSDAVSLARAERVIGVRFCLILVDFVPSVRVEHFRILVETLLKMVRFDQNSNCCAFFDGYFANKMLPGCLSLKNTIGRTIHSQSLLLYLLQILELLQLFKSDV